MGNHTKRTPAFKAEIEEIIEKELMGKWAGDKGSRINRLIEILRNNTTDSPCMVKAKEDEPVFVLRGQDYHSNHVVDVWTQRVKKLVGGSNDMIADAEECSKDMANYHTKKFPD